jgi:hypothetical protein
MSQELLQRIGSMVDFVGQCASILEGQTLDSVGSDNKDPCSIINIPAPSPSYSITLSPSKASHMVDFKMEETDMFIPRIRPRVDSVYDESSFFDEAGLPRSVGPLESVSPLESGSSMLPGLRHMTILLFFVVVVAVVVVVLDPFCLVLTMRDIHSLIPFENKHM